MLYSWNKNDSKWIKYDKITLFYKKCYDGVIIVPYVIIDLIYLESTYLKRDMAKCSIVQPIMHSSMLYNLGL